MAEVLLAADVEPTSSRVVARLALEASGHAVHEVHDGFEALAVAETLRPDVLVLDTALAGLDGFQVLTRMRRRAALRALPAVVMSSIPRDAAGELARSLGAVRFLTRPFTNTDLEEAVAVALESGAATEAAPTIPDWRPQVAVGRRGRRGAEAAGVLDLPRPPSRRVRVARRRSRGA